MTTLDVDTRPYHNAAAQLSILADQCQSAVTGVLVPGLSATGGLAGNTASVTTWTKQYQKAADDVGLLIRLWANAVRHFGDILAACGYNWDEAEWTAGGRKGDEPTKPALPSGPGMEAGDIPPIPNPLGDNGPGLILAPESFSAMYNTPAYLTLWTIPGARTDLLAAAAKAWADFAATTVLSDASATLKGLRNPLTTVKAPEIEDAATIFTVLDNASLAVIAVTDTVAASLRKFHDELVDLRNVLAYNVTMALRPHPVDTAVTDAAVRIATTNELTEQETADGCRKIANLYAEHPVSGLLMYADIDPAFDIGEQLRWSGPLLDIVALPLPNESGNTADNTVDHHQVQILNTWDTPPGTVGALVDASKIDPQMRTWVAAAVKYGNEAGVDPRMVLAIILKEGGGRDLKYGSWLDSSYDELREDMSWARDNSLGFTNMKEQAFNKIKGRYPMVFSGDNWSDLNGNQDLAIKAAAYNLKYLQEDYAPRVPPEVSSQQSLHQFLASGYNSNFPDGAERVVTGTGGFIGNETAYGRSVADPGGLYDKANQIICGSGAYKCTPN